MILRFRRLRPWDSSFCKELASLDSVRDASLNSTLPTFRGHLKWMWRQIVSREHKAWIIIGDGRRIGLVRGRTVWSGGSEISIAITACARARGVGKESLRAITPKLERPVYARIKLGNIASVRAFKSAGYRNVFLAKDWENLGGPGIVVLVWP